MLNDFNFDFQMIIVFPSNELASYILLHRMTINLYIILIMIIDHVMSNDD